MEENKKSEKIDHVELDQFNEDEFYNFDDEIHEEVLREVFDTDLEPIQLIIPSWDSNEERDRELTKRFKLLQFFNDKAQSRWESLAKNKEDKGDNIIPLDQVFQFPIDELKSGTDLSSWLPKTKKDFEISSYDLIESGLGFFLSSSENLTDEYFIRLNNYSGNKFNFKKHKYHRDFALGQGDYLKRISYLRIRAKLVFWEILYLLHEREEVLFYLVQVTPLYLRSRCIHRKIFQTRAGEKITGDFIGRLTNSLRAKYFRPLDYEYFRVHHFYLKMSNAVKKEAFAKSDLDSLLKRYNHADHGLPKELLESELTSPHKFQQTTENYMHGAGMIDETTTHSHVIFDEIKKIKKYLNDEIHPWVELAYDEMMSSKKSLNQFNIWEELDTFNLNNVHYQPE